MPILPTNEEIQRSIEKADKTRIQHQDIHYNYSPYAPSDDISEEWEVEKMIESSPEVQLENLQPSCKHPGPIAQEPPRRNKRIYTKLHPPAPPGPITQSMAKKGAIAGVSSFAYFEENNIIQDAGEDPHKFHKPS